TCDDGNACTKNDVCTAGTCGGTAFTCAAPDQCHEAGTCNGDGTCPYATKSAGRARHDGTPGTQNDARTGGKSGGRALNREPPDQCHQDRTCNGHRTR